MLTLADAEWLAGHEAQEWLQRTSTDTADPLSLVARLRKTCSPGQCHLLVQQLQLRCRARGKFARAEQMLFTPTSLEQATGSTLAHYKARRFIDCSKVADLCCGIGGDTIGLAKRTTTAASDRDAALVHLCQHNLRTHELEAELHCCAAERVDVAQVDAWHVDPDRRASGRRTTRVEHYSPNLEAIERLVAVNPNVAIKLAPASQFDLPGIPLERQWLGHGRECQQQVAWCGRLAKHAGKRSAVVLDRQGRELGTTLGTGQERAPRGTLSHYLIDPHPALVAARLVGALAEQHGLQAFDPSVAYLTSTEPSQACGSGCFEILVALPFDTRTLRKELTARDLAVIEVKKRGVDVDPNSLARQLSKGGQQPCTVVLTPWQGKISALITRRINEGED